MLKRLFERLLHHGFDLKVLPHRMFNKLATKTKTFFVTIKVCKVDELNNTEHGCDDVKLQQAVG